MGRHLGVFSCTMLMYPHFLAILKFLLIGFFSSIGRIIGTGIFSTPSSILGSVGSVGASLLLWVAGFFLSFCGLFIWLEFGTMFPRSGGEKVYLEAVYRRPKYLATVIFSATAIILGLSASACIVSPFPNAFIPFFMWLVFRSSLRSMNKDLHRKKRSDDPKKHTCFRRTFSRSLGGTRYSHRRYTTCFLLKILAHIR